MSVAWLERHQVTLYVAGLGLGSTAGLLWPRVAHPAELAIQPALALLLFATFLGIPFVKVGLALRDWRFLATVLAVNFVAVPPVVWLLSRIVVHDQALLIGVLFVLLTPCIDYVIVFAGLAGGDTQRLLAAAPILLIAQMLLLPLYLWLFVGAEFARSVEIAPFIKAFVFIIAVPMLAAALTQLAAARSLVGHTVERAVAAAMVPLMVATLAIVVASQIAGVGARLGALLLTIPVYVLFAAVMVPIGLAASRATGLDISGTRAVLFSGTTRNSLVVLPLVLALPTAFDLAPLVLVTQTLVELVIMVVFVRVVPRLVPQHP